MFRRASSKHTATTNADEDAGVEELKVVPADLEGGNGNALAVSTAPLVLHAATAFVTEEDNSDLTWTDNFFSDRTDVVAAFDLNQEEYARSKRECAVCLFWVGNVVTFVFLFAFLMAGGSFNNVGVVIMAFVYGCFAFMLVAARKQRIKVWIPHLAVTTTGVRYVEPPENESRFLGSTVHIPFEAIEAIDINSGGSVGIRTSSLDWIDFVLHGAPRGLRKIRRYQVLSEWKEEIIQTGPDYNGMRLDINFLVEPYQFKKLVLSLKRRQQEAMVNKEDEEIGRSEV